MVTTITLRGTARNIGRGAAAFAILTHEDIMAKATPVETEKYRFVGRNHTHQGKPLAFGDVVDLTERQARSWAGKFRRLGAGAADAGQIQAEGRVEAEQAITNAQAEATARIEGARAQAASILRAADEEVGRILTDAQKQTEQRVQDARATAANAK